MNGEPALAIVQRWRLVDGGFEHVSVLACTRCDMKPWMPLSLFLARWGLFPRRIAYPRRAGPSERYGRFCFFALGLGL